MNSRKVLIVAGSTVIAILLFCLLFYNFWFLRDPERSIPAGNVVVSPTDGTVVRIFSTNENIDIDKGIFGGVVSSSLEVSPTGVDVIVIMMTPLDVHYQRAPITGEISTVQYVPGEFVSATSDAASLRQWNNEKNEILIKGEINVKVIQIAGTLARRIVDYLNTGQIVAKGEKIGLIKLGSMVVLMIPEHLDVLVSEDEYVYGGETIIAEI